MRWHPFNGKRGLFLFCHTVIFAMIGLSFLSLPSLTSRVAAFWYMEPGYLHLLGWPWLIGALLSLVCSARAMRRFDWIGYAAINAVLLLFAGLYLVAWLSGHSASAWVSVAIWGGYSAGVFVVASWPNPVVQPPTPPLMEA